MTSKTVKVMPTTVFIDRQPTDMFGAATDDGVWYAGCDRSDLVTEPVEYVRTDSDQRFVGTTGVREGELRVIKLTPDSPWTVMKAVFRKNDDGSTTLAFTDDHVWYHTETYVIGQAIGKP